jgi:hypothetical protein
MFGGSDLSTTGAIEEVRRRYDGRGIRSGSELLLLPSDAIEFSHAAEGLGLSATGVDVWTLSPDGAGLSQDAGSGRYVPSEILEAPFAATASHAIVRDYLMRWLPQKTVRVHVGLADPQTRK